MASTAVSLSVRSALGIARTARLILPRESLSCASYGKSGMDGGVCRAVGREGPVGGTSAARAMATLSWSPAAAAAAAATTTSSASASAVTSGVSSEWQAYYYYGAVAFLGVAGAAGLTTTAHARSEVRIAHRSTRRLAPASVAVR